MGDRPGDRIRLLHVEDDAALVAVVRPALCDAGFEVDVAEDAGKALRLAEKHVYDLALVDLRLPGAMDGLAFARWLRARWPTTGIVMLTVVGDGDSRVRALEDSCDDYLVKPCEITELIARLHAVARRSSRAPVSSVFTWGPFRVDLFKSRVWVNEREVKGLQPLQVRFLGYLVQNAERVCAHAELTANVLNPDNQLGGTSMGRVVSILRARCGKAARLIITVKGIGYGVGIHAPAKCDRSSIESLPSDDA